MKKHAARLHDDRLPIDESTDTVAVKRQVQASIYIYIVLKHIIFYYFYSPGNGFGGPGGGFSSSSSNSGLPLCLLPLEPPPRTTKAIARTLEIVKEIRCLSTMYIYIYICTVLTAYQDENQDD